MCIEEEIRVDELTSSGTVRGNRIVNRNLGRKFFGSFFRNMRAWFISGTGVPRFKPPVVRATG